MTALYAVSSLWALAKEWPSRSGGTEGRRTKRWEGRWPDWEGGIWGHEQECVSGACWFTLAIVTPAQSLCEQEKKVSAVSFMTRKFVIRLNTSSLFSSISLRVIDVLVTTAYLCLAYIRHAVKYADISQVG